MLMHAKRLIPVVFGLTAMAAVIVAGLAAAGCAQDRVAHERQHDNEHIGHYRPEMVDMSDVMQAKMLHTQAIVEGLARGDLRQVAVNAEVMHELSDRATWFVHETVTYLALSEEFRDLMARMSHHARMGDMDAVIEDYTAVTRSCIACHTYLRKELREKDLPGAVSMLSSLD